MKCNHCGARISEDSHSCPNCGEVLSAGQGSLHKKRTNIYLALLILVLSAILVYTLYCTVSFFVNPDQSDRLTPGLSMSPQYMPDVIQVPAESPRANTATSPVGEESLNQSPSSLVSIYPLELTQTPQTQVPVIEKEELINSEVAPSQVNANTPIMGRSIVTASDLATFYKEHSPIDFPQYYIDRGVSLENFAQIYVDECENENVRADLAFAQMIHETGFLKYGGKVKIEQLNFAGIGTNTSDTGINFAELYGDNSFGIQMGIRAQVQHLKAYASFDQLVEDSVDPLFTQVKRASAPTISNLAGTWSSDTNYAHAVLEFLNAIEVNS